MRPGISCEIGFPEPSGARFGYAASMPLAARGLATTCLVLACTRAPDGSDELTEATTATTAPTGPAMTATTAADSTGPNQTSFETSEGVDSGGSSGSPPSPPACPRRRAPEDLADDSSEPQVRVLYVVPADSRDRGLDLDGMICGSVLGWTAWLEEQSGGRSLRLDTADGVLDIGFHRLELSDAQMHGTNAAASVETGFAYVRDRIERELLAMGALAPNKLYAVYYGGTSEYACGGGAYPPLIVDQVAAMYLEGQPTGSLPCDSGPWGAPGGVLGYIDYGMLHELFHTLGAVDPLAPHQHAGGHAFDVGERAPERDLMYSPRAGESDPPWGVYDPGGLVLDLGRDDYFDHADPERVDVARSVFLEPRPMDATLPPGW